MLGGALPETVSLPLLPQDVRNRADKVAANTAETPLFKLFSRLRPDLALLTNFTWNPAVTGCPGRRSSPADHACRLQACPKITTALYFPVMTKFNNLFGLVP